MMPSGQNHAFDVPSVGMEYHTYFVWFIANTLVGSNYVSLQKEESVFATCLRSLECCALPVM